MRNIKYHNANFANSLAVLLDNIDKGLLVIWSEKLVNDYKLTKHDKRDIKKTIKHAYDTGYLPNDKLFLSDRFYNQVSYETQINKGSE